ncbi:MAG: flagellar hook-length control protein FliK, partial [Terriglobia bacterium]
PSGRAAAKPKTIEDSTRKPFSKVLESRRGKEKHSPGSEKPEGQENKLSDSKGKLEDGAVIGKPLPLSGSSLDQTGEAASKVSSAQPMILKEPIQALAKEIWHGVNAQGQEQIDIHLNSKVFDGLKIQIVRDSDRLNIRFEGASDTVTQLLNRNVGALTESLAAHGIRVGHIRVGESETARWAAHKAQNRPRTGGQGRRRQS